MAETGQTASFFLANPFRLHFDLVDKDQSGPPYPPLNITGRQIVFSLCRFSKSGNPLKAPVVEKTTGAGVTIVDGPTGSMDVDVDDEDTVDLLPAAYYFEVEVFDASGEDGVVVATGTINLGINVGNPP